MCGRYTLHLEELADLRELLGVQRLLIHDFRPRYNIAPTQLAPVVVVAGPDHERTLRPLRFGLPRPGEPHAGGSGKGHGTAGHRSGRNLLINARVETVAVAPAFRDAFRTRRCVVPATGFFEWRALPGGGGKQPYWLRPDDERVMALAGVWTPQVSEDGEVLDAFAILTTDARGAARAIHARMPLSLHGSDVDLWLGQERINRAALQALVARSAEHEEAHLIASEVDRRVNSSDIDDPGCLAPPGEGAEHAVRQLGLFAPDAAAARRSGGGR